MSTKYTKWTDIWKFLTPLNSTHLEVFLRFFHLFEFKFKILNPSGFKLVGTGPDPVDRFPPVWLTLSKSRSV
jgi:hypothetical protein